MTEAEDPTPGLWIATPGRVVAVPEDRLLRKLADMLPKIKRRPDWGLPLSLALTIAAVLPGADFKFSGNRQGIPASTWSDVVRVAFAVTLVWLSVSLWRRWKHQPVSATDILEEIMRDEGQPVAGRPPLPAQQAVAASLQAASPGRSSSTTALRIGSQVRHKSHGAGRVTQLSATEVTVDFEGAGPRTLMRQFATLSVLPD